MDNSYRYVLKDMDPHVRKYGEGYRQRNLVWKSGSSISGSSVRHFDIEYNNRPQVVLQLMFMLTPLWTSIVVAQLLLREKSFLRQSLPSVLFGFTSRRANSIYVYSEGGASCQIQSAVQGQKNHASNLPWNFKGITTYADNSETRQMEQMICRFRTTSE